MSNSLYQSLHGRGAPVPGPVAQPPQQMAPQQAQQTVLDNLLSFVGNYQGNAGQALDQLMQSGQLNNQVLNRAVGLSKLFYPLAKRMFPNL